MSYATNSPRQVGSKPKLPAKLREGLEKSHQRYGHLDSFDTMIRVTRVIEAAEVSDDVPASKR
jgi:hypothetical protein